jgi:uncharacterized radical SAM superfamily Fe-S cluster-containing enzyme
MTALAGGTVLRWTESVCPECLARIPATLVDCTDEIRMVKECPDHGVFRSVIWRGTPAFNDWRRPKAPARVREHATAVDKGCPYDCGICPDHRQLGCTGLLEVTGRCNLSCSVCFADSGPVSSPDPTLETIAGWYSRVLAANGPCSIQLSGGEPTLRDDLPEIIELGRKAGFSFIQLNSNGLRLAAEADYARRLREAGLVSVFLQYDGTEEEIHRQLRGRAMLLEKHRAIAHCTAAGLGVVLVPTVVPGINTHNLGEMVRTALDFGPGVRGVHFQPASRFGRFAVEGGPERFTLPEVIAALERQTAGLVKTGDFLPPGCEHERCSFHGSFIRTKDGGLRPVSAPTEGNCCCAGPADKEADVLRTVNLVASQWAGPATGAEKESGLGADGAMDLDAFLAQAQRNSFTLSGMAFQDAWNLDLDRLRSCCIHVVAPDGRLVPFCAYNLTAADGTPLYRKSCV